MVTEIDSSTAGSSSSMRESVLLPAPEGEDRTNIIPRRATTGSAGGRVDVSAMLLFQVLHLLAELLDHAFELKADIGEFHVVRLGAERI